MNNNTPAAETSVVWAFDLGKASLGEAVRMGDELRHAESWLIPEDFAQRGPASKAGTPANRYRAMKTREAHLAREARLRELCTEAGIEALSPRDRRLTDQFPAKTDATGTCYTSCLLRIQLLRGVKLEGWQVFKALHSAIQRRGYDRNLAWKNKRTTKSSDGKEETETNQRLGEYQRALEQIAAGNTDYIYPCYLDAWRMGLWAPSKPDHYELRINHLTAPARNREHPDNTPVVAPRELVEAEVRSLLVAAAKLFPKLSGHADEIVHGPGAVPYASYFPQLRKQHGLREGGANDWLGILGQKVPRFDNRIIAKCALIPRLNVCKNERRQDASGNFYLDSLLPAEVTFLLKLKNVRVQLLDKQIVGLTAEQIHTIFENPARKITELSFTEKQWGKQCLKFGALPVPGHEEIKAPRDGGRSRFCRPALKILKALILSGEAPATAHARELAALNGNTKVNKGLIEADLDFMKQMGETWDRLYIPDQQHDALLRIREQQGRDIAIRTLLGSVNDPIVRHRLETLWGRIQKLEQVHGIPSEVVLEFVRDDFLGADAKRELQKFQNDREKARKEAREQARQSGATGRAASLKYELLKQQGFQCLYTGNTISATQLDECEIEHIVPRAQGGPDAVVNYVVTTVATNKEKDNRTPYEWFAANGFAGWDAYLKRVDGCATQLRNKKIKLLTSPEAKDLVRRYTALAETAWIARLSQTLVALYFDWPIRSEEGARRITIISGGLTARVRRQYKLNSLLRPDTPPEGTDPLEWEELCEKKNRDDDRHHALDAMVLSFIPGWTRDPSKKGFFRLPDGVTRETFGKKIAEVVPTPLAFPKAILAETIYGARKGKDQRPIIVQRVHLQSLGMKPISPAKTKFDLDYLEKQIVSVRDACIKKKLLEFHATNPDENAWSGFCRTFTLDRQDGSLGARIKRVSVFVGSADEYKDLSKDGSGAWRKAKKGHKGQIVYLDPTGQIAIRPVYAHGSVYNEQKKLGPQSKFQGFYQSECTIQTNAHLPAGSYKMVVLNEEKKKRRIAGSGPLSAGKYCLKTIITKSLDVEMTTANGTRVVTQLGTLVTAGLKRV